MNTIWRQKTAIRSATVACERDHSFSLVIIAALSVQNLTPLPSTLRTGEPRRPDASRGDRQPDQEARSDLPRSGSTPRPGLAGERRLPALPPVRSVPGAVQTARTLARAEDSHRPKSPSLFLLSFVWSPHPTTTIRHRYPLVPSSRPRYYTRAVQVRRAGGTLARSSLALWFPPTPSSVHIERHAAAEASENKCQPRL